MSELHLSPDELKVLARKIQRQVTPITQSFIDLTTQQGESFGYIVTLSERRSDGSKGVSLSLGQAFVAVIDANSQYKQYNFNNIREATKSFSSGLQAADENHPPQWEQIAPTADEFRSRLELHLFTFEAIKQWLSACDAALARSGTVEWEITSPSDANSLDMSYAEFAVFHSYQDGDNVDQVHRLRLVGENPQTGALSYAEIEAGPFNGPLALVATGEIDVTLEKWRELCETVAIKVGTVVSAKGEGASSPAPLTGLLGGGATGGLYLDFRKYAPVAATMQAAIDFAGTAQWRMNCFDLARNPEHVVCTVRQMMGAIPGAEIVFRKKSTDVSCPEIVGMTGDVIVQPSTNQHSAVIASSPGDENQTVVDILRDFSTKCMETYAACLADIAVTREVDDSVFPSGDLGNNDNGPER